MKQEVSIFDKQCTNKNAVHKNKKSTSINQVGIKRTELSKK